MSKGFGKAGIKLNYGNGETVDYEIKQIDEKFDANNPMADHFLVRLDALTPKHKGRVEFFPIFIVPPADKYRESKIKDMFIKAMYTDKEIQEDDLSPAKILGRKIRIKWGDAATSSKGNTFQSPVQMHKVDPAATAAKTKPKGPATGDEDFNSFDDDIPFG